MSNTPRLRGLNGRPIAAPVAEPAHVRMCPDGRSCGAPGLPEAGVTSCADVAPPACLRVDLDTPKPGVFPADTWPATITADPAPVVAIDGILVPPGFVDHNGLEWKALTVDTAAGVIRATATTGRGWYRCTCGWVSGPIDPANLAGRLPIPQGDAWTAWAEHLPPGFLAFREALVQWRDDHPGHTMPAIGWDGVDRYAWRSWGTPRIDDAGRIVVPRKADPPPAVEG